MDTGTIFNVQKYSVHDGPGIRTTLFFKGCPLNCWWCHNPESQRSAYELMFFTGRCIGCGECIKKCSAEASKIIEGKLIFDREKCTGCGQCIDTCPANARDIAGKKVTVDYLWIIMQGVQGTIQCMYRE